MNHRDSSDLLETFAVIRKKFGVAQHSREERSLVTFKQWKKTSLEVDDFSGNKLNSTDWIKVSNSSDLFSSFAVSRRLNTCSETVTCWWLNYIHILQVFQQLFQSFFVV